MARNPHPLRAHVGVTPVLRRPRPSDEDLSRRRFAEALGDVLAAALRSGDRDTAGRARSALRELGWRVEQ